MTIKGNSLFNSYMSKLLRLPSSVCSVEKVSSSIVGRSHPFLFHRNLAKGRLLINVACVKEVYQITLNPMTNHDFKKEQEKIIK